MLMQIQPPFGSVLNSQASLHPLRRRIVVKW
jgi:hypothetical protein